MSNKALDLVNRRRFGSVHRKAVARSLADHADAQWSTFVGQERIAAEAEVGIRTARRILADFAALGLIRRIPQYGGKWGRRSDITVLERVAIERLPIAIRAKQPQSLPATLAAREPISTGHWCISTGHWRHLYRPRWPGNPQGTLSRTVQQQDHLRRRQPVRLPQRPHQVPLNA